MIINGAWFDLKEKRQGFTLIETLVYLALLGMVFVGLFAAGFAIVESLDALKTRAIAQEEGNFILAKLNWAAVEAKSAEISGGKLVFKNPDRVFEFDADNGDIKIDDQILNAAIVKLKDCVFDVDAKKASASFVVYAKTPFGKTYEQPFTITNYLRR